MPETEKWRVWEWAEVEKYLGEMVPVKGGYTKATRGLVEINGGKVFVKIGVDENTRKWIKKEIAVYKFLIEHGYSHIPQLISVNADDTGFAIGALTENEGWDWSKNWSEGRLTATLLAMDDLAAIHPTEEDLPFFTAKTVDENDDGWVPLARSVESQQQLINNLRESENEKIADSIKFETIAELSAKYVFRNTELVHNDVRADNCAWNESKHEVKLVDWNWAQIGDRKIDVNAFLVSVQLSGFDVTRSQLPRLDREALMWLAGFWFKSCIVPTNSESGKSLREFQLKSGITAYSLMQRLNNEK